jgi:hypothetical protein
MVRIHLLPAGSLLRTVISRSTAPPSVIGRLGLRLAGGPSPSTPIDRTKVMALRSGHSARAEGFVGTRTSLPIRVVNWSHKSDRMRLKVRVRVPHDSDLYQALALMREAASYPERVLAVPAPNALIMAFGETAIELELRFWIEDAQNGVHKSRARFFYEIWRLFGQEGIQIPYPKRDLFVRPELRT